SRRSPRASDSRIRVSSRRTSSGSSASRRAVSAGPHAETPRGREARRCRRAPVREALPLAPNDIHRGGGSLSKRGRKIHAIDPIVGAQRSGREESDHELSPRDLCGALHFEPAATSFRLGWVGMELAHYHATPAYEVDYAGQTHHGFTLFTRPPD